MSSDRSRGALRPAIRERGYNLVALIVILVVINIAVAAAMPLWSNVVRRDREAELLFRGWQYAEAIRVFQARFGRYPVRLAELIEVEPRCIRQLWTDPLSDSGAWEPILAGSGQQTSQERTGGRPQREGTPGQQVAGGQAPGRPTSQPPAGESSQPTAFDAPQVGALPGETGERIGPIEGVRPTASGTALKSFLGRTTYREWEFRAAMLAGPALNAQGVPQSPRIGADSLSRPLLPSETAPGSPTGSSPPVRPTPDSEASDDN